MCSGVMLGAGLEILRGLRNVGILRGICNERLVCSTKEGNWKPVDLEALAGDLHHTH